MRKYQLSYEPQNLQQDFDNDPLKAWQFMVCVLLKTSTLKMEQVNSHTIMIHYENYQKSRLFGYLRENLSPWFYFTVSLVPKIKGTGDSLIFHHKHPHLNQELQKMISEGACNDGGKPIGEY